MGAKYPVTPPQFSPDGVSSTPPSAPSGDSTSRSARPPSVREVVAATNLRKPDGTPFTGLLAPERAERLLRRFRHDASGDRLAPYLMAAESLLEQFIGEVAATAGQCGPIAASVLHTSAYQKSVGVFYADVAAEQSDPLEAVRLTRMASALQTESRQNALAALDLSVKIARSAPRPATDPLAGFLDHTQSPAQDNDGGSDDD